MLSRLALLSFALLFSSLPAARPEALAAPGIRAGAISHGLALALIVPRQVYPRNALVRVTIRARNVSSHVILLARSSLCGVNPEVQVVGGSGAILYPPALQDVPDPSCGARRPPLRLRPGHRLTRRVFVILRSSHLRGVAELGDGSKVKTRLLTLRLTRGQPPKVTVHTTPTVFAQVQLSGPTRGYLYYTAWWTCQTTGSTPVVADTLSSGLGPGFLATSGSRLVPDWDPTCTADREWHAIAGWLGQPVATIDYTGPAGVQFQPSHTNAHLAFTYFHFNEPLHIELPKVGSSRA